MTGKDMIAIFAPDKNVKVYHYKEWWGDAWDARDYGMDYDPSRSFFDQFKELMAQAPWPSLVVDSANINCDYVNHVGTSKDCYLVFNVDHSENLYYSEISTHCRDSMDSVMLNKGELCYDVVDGNGSRIKYSENCDECVGMWFSKDCVGCSDCFGCVNLRKQSYCIWNVQYSREEYFEKLKSMDLTRYTSLENIKKQARAFWLQFPRRYYHGRQNVKSTGDYLYYSKNAKGMYQTVYMEDSKYCQFMTSPSSKDCYDITEWGENIELCCDSATVGDNSQNIRFSYWASRGASDIEYSMFVPGSQSCFGCCNMKKGKYCILNKQYTKEEYFALREKIIQDMNEHPYVDSLGRVFKYGDFFPYDLSPFDYNESFAYPYFKLTKEEALAAGFTWSERATNQYTATVHANDLPETIADTSDAITKEAVECIECKKVYKITEGELTLLRKLDTPVPRHCFMCRYYERLSRINPNALYKRQCQCSGASSENSVYKNTVSHEHGEGQCQNEFETSYAPVFLGDTPSVENAVQRSRAPDRPEIVYCEQCYQKEVL